MIVTAPSRAVLQSEVEMEKTDQCPRGSREKTATREARGDAGNLIGDYIATHTFSSIETLSLFKIEIKEKEPE